MIGNILITKRKQKRKRCEGPKEEIIIKIENRQKSISNTFVEIAKEVIANPRVEIEDTVEALSTKFRESYDEFSYFQVQKDINSGDQILYEHINIYKLTVWQCRQLFGIGSSRYNKIKSGKLHEYGKCRGVQPPKEYRQKNQAIVFIFIKFVMESLHDSYVLCPLDFEGNRLSVRPNIDSWKTKKDIWENYCLFHNEVGISTQPYSIKTFIKMLKKYNGFKALMDKLKTNTFLNSSNNAFLMQTTTSIATTSTSVLIDLSPTASMLNNGSGTLHHPLLLRETYGTTTPANLSFPPRVEERKYIELTVLYFNGFAVAIGALNCYEL